MILRLVVLCGLIISASGFMLGGNTVSMDIDPKTGRYTLTTAHGVTFSSMNYTLTANGQIFSSGEP